MLSDRYTKVVLTVIAGALLWICVRDAMPVAHADAGAEQTWTLSSPLPVKIVAIERGTWTMRFGPLPQDTNSFVHPWEPIDVVQK